MDKILPANAGEKIARAEEHLSLWATTTEAWAPALLNTRSHGSERASHVLPRREEVLSRQQNDQLI